MRLYKVIPDYPPVEGFSAEFYVGERLVDMIQRALLNGAPVESTHQPFYDEDDDDDVFVVDPMTDIRTDKWSMAERALLESPKGVSNSMTRDAEVSASVPEDKQSDSEPVSPVTELVSPVTGSES